MSSRWVGSREPLAPAQVIRAAAEVGKRINASRARRGLQPRAVRAVVIGFPNIGKSALVNRLAGRRVASSAAKPGVTRQLTWLRLHGDIDLLDTPGDTLTPGVTPSPVLLATEPAHMLPGDVCHAELAS